MDRTGIRKTKSHEMDMIHGPLFGKLLVFAIPLMVSGILQLLFNAADVVVVGRFAGDDSLAAVGSTTSLINLMTNLFIGFSVGINVYVAHCFGSSDQGKISSAIHTSVMLALICGALLTVFGVTMAGPILKLMSSPVEVIGLATRYLQIYFLGMPGTMLYNFGSAILRASGDTRRPLYYLTFAGMINVAFNLYLVIHCSLGVVGVGIATVVSQYIAAGLIIGCLMREKGVLHLDITGLRIEKEDLIKILQIGLPAGIQGTVFSLSNVVIQSSINSFGNIEVAANAAAASLEGFVYMAMNALYQTALTFISQNYGAGEKKRIIKVLIYCQFIVIVVGTVLGRIFVVFGRELLHIYSQSDIVIDAGMVRLQYICGVYAFCGIMDVMVGALRGIGYSVMPMIVSLIGACGLRLLWIATVFRSYHTTRILYLSYVVTWVITASVHLICFMISYRKRFVEQNDLQ